MPDSSAVPTSGHGSLHPEYPTLPAYDTGRNLIVWCDHCRHWHAHGRGEKGGSDGNGHRVAHCYKPHSPYDRWGYILHYAGGATQDMLKDLQRRRQRGPSWINQVGEVRP